MSRQRGGEMGATLLVTALALGLVVLSTAGCEDDAVCFNCGADGTGAQAASGATSHGGGGTGGGLGGDCLFNCGGGGTGGTGGGTTCVPTNGGVEICDELDNDCNGTIDDDFDKNSPEHCGTCTNNCFALLINTDPATVTCDWDGTPGTDGTCAFGSCAQDYHDWTSAPGCESYCVQTAQDDSDCNNRDDDCDGTADEDVDLCGIDNCGQCNRACNVVHGTPGCRKINPAGPCDATNTECYVAACDDDDVPPDGLADWHNADDDPATPQDEGYLNGCEYNCEFTDGDGAGGADVGVEVCGDGVDNDCDYLIDAADDLSGDPRMGAPCFGDPDGWCADPVNTGAYECQGNQVVCGGNAVFEDEVPETCNDIDDDCDGVVDDDPAQVGDSCQTIAGNSGTYPCRYGTWACNPGGSLDCENEVGPGIETCNGIDDDCDGTMDNNLTDVGTPCDVPASTPPDCTTACSAGTWGCDNGARVCQGSVTRPPGTPDTCGIDENCDGFCNWPGDVQSDPFNCGLTHAAGCGNDCYQNAGATPLETDYLCVSGVCTYNGCKPGWIDCVNPGDGICDTQCTFGGTETCNDYDDDCNCIVDDVAPGDTPSPAQVCGVSVGATADECVAYDASTNPGGVEVTCGSGAWNCTFHTATVCTGGCSADDEICEEPALDNDCDGLLNENVGNWNQACQTPISDGECRGSGTYVCNGTDATSCNAVPLDCLTLPDQCVEYCDGKDNDCDGDIDENFTDKGADTAYFVKPNVVQIAGGLWMYTFEASRPNAGPATSGSGNGYHCTAGGECATWVPFGRGEGVPDPPAGVTLDATPACSVAGRIPWFNASPTEAEHTCYAMGGHLCNQSDWTTACQATVSCLYGYSPRGAACTSGWLEGSRDCNIFPHPFGGSAGAHGLLPTGDTSELENCWADLQNVWGNPSLPRGQTTNSLYDLTGNLREIAYFGPGSGTPPASNVYALMGGSFFSPEGGATCTFDFYKADIDYKLLDTGFRCCFTTDPTQ